MTIEQLWAPSDTNSERERDPIVPALLKGTGRLAGKKVVIVEDEGITQLQLKRLVSSAGMIVAGVAKNGVSGVETVLREQPDIVLMDIKMPGEINGIEAARRILAQASVCIVFLTAYADLVEEARKAGACGYIEKPVDSQTLISELETAFRNSQPQ